MLSVASKAETPSASWESADSLVPSEKIHHSQPRKTTPDRISQQAQKTPVYRGTGNENVSRCQLPFGDATHGPCRSQMFMLNKCMARISDSLVACELCATEIVTPKHAVRCKYYLFLSVQSGRSVTSAIDFCQ